MVRFKTHIRFKKIRVRSVAYMVSVFNSLKHSGIDIADIVFIAGLSVLAYGFSLVYQPLGFISAGVVMLWISLPKFPKSGGT
jgi:uncharacterized membrane protein